MVRLKDSIARAHRSASRISIPHGTIKSHFPGACCAASTRFQFHMVRLKVSLSPARQRLANLFQFHMVRLKAMRGEGGGAEPGGFQFHMVRLKDAGHKGYWGLGLFQFHMVRLKAGRHWFRQRCRQFQFHMVRLKATAGTSPRGCATFQFHMVRLKGCVTVFYGVTSDISIPHGTIKSALGFHRRYLGVQFQFHMVRLKAGLDIINALQKHLFQFHMVRLKAGKPRRLCGPLGDFNSTWYD